MEALTCTRQPVPRGNRMRLPHGAENEDDPFPMRKAAGLSLSWGGQGWQEQSLEAGGCLPTLPLLTRVEQGWAMRWGTPDPLPWPYHVLRRTLPFLQLLFESRTMGQSLAVLLMALAEAAAASPELEGERVLLFEDLRELER